MFINIMKEAKLYQKLKEKRLKCLACSNECIISNGKKGICGVRKNINGKLQLLVHGMPCAVHVDPIEKKPLYHFLPGSLAFSIGTIGCNFKCPWCQNWDISQNRDENFFSKELLTPKKAVSLAILYGCKSIAYTYNEPAIFSEYIKDIAKLAKKEGLKNILVTNGYFTKESFDFLNKEHLIDAANIDLKAFKDETYRKYCGSVKGIKPVLENIKRFHKAKIHIEVTTLIIPNLNDSKKELKQIAEFIASIDKNIPWHISRYFPQYKMDEKKHPVTKIETLKLAEKIGKATGLRYVYIGNV
ncbi:AmmeMemoRadiSam system radical SAM enzyme [Candidatus Pacearchaeota archaeon]|nr:MAG: AmmeMemoRadiSam system radical SAM enzyme [Candidatus Pacearchaeota archaeon]